MSVHDSQAVLLIIHPVQCGRVCSTRVSASCKHVLKSGCAFRSRTRLVARPYHGINTAVDHKISGAERHRRNRLFGLGDDQRGGADNRRPAAQGQLELLRDTKRAEGNVKHESDNMSLE